MTDAFKREQKAYGCSQGRSCGCLDEDERAAAEAELAELNRLTPPPTGPGQPDLDALTI